MKSFTEEIANRKTEVHHEDFSLLLTSTQIWNLLNSPVHEKYENRFEELDDPGAQFVELRDYLMTMLLVQSAERPGAVCNLTIDEFHAGEWDDSTGVKQFVTLTKCHKTAGTVNFVKYEGLFFWYSANRKSSFKVLFYTKWYMYAQLKMCRVLM